MAKIKIGMADTEVRYGIVERKSVLRLYLTGSEVGIVSGRCCEGHTVATKYCQLPDNEV